MTAIFITGTGTDVGKTYVAASLIGHLRHMGRQVEALKPVVSGFDPTDYGASDPAVLAYALGLPATPEEIERISPWRFQAAVSPDLAASYEGRRIDFDSVVAYCQKALTHRRDILLIEGAGGIMVPLDEERTMLDLMMALNLPLILVAGSYLGTISHTLTALDALYRRDLRVVATIVNESEGSTVPLNDTVATMARFTTPVIGLPRRGARTGPPNGGVGRDVDDPEAAARSAETLAAFQRIFGT